MRVCVQSREVMKRELKARQEANIRGLLSVMEVSQVLRAEQLAAPLQPNLVPVPPLVRPCPSMTILSFLRRRLVAVTGKPCRTCHMCFLQQLEYALLYAAVLHPCWTDIDRHLFFSWRASASASAGECNLLEMSSVRVSLQGVSGPTLVPGSTTFVDGGHFAATRELSPRTQAALVICPGLFNCLLLPPHDLDSLWGTCHTLLCYASARTFELGYPSCIPLHTSLLGSEACNLRVVIPGELTSASHVCYSPSERVSCVPSALRSCMTCRLV